MEASSSSEPSFDAFLSFDRDEVDSYRFTKLLHESLCRYGMKVIVFMENEKSVIGNNLSDEVLKAIEGSRFSIIVLSKSYVSSRLCLREVARIMDHSNSTTHQVLPIYCFGLEPHGVQQDFNEFIDSEQKGTYLKEVQVWRDAITKITSLSQVYVSSKISGKPIERVMKTILDKLFHLKLVARNSYLLEMSLRIRTINMLLDKISSDVRFIGIVGMGGIGKTTIAEAFYVKYAHTYTKSCFLRIDGISNLVSLQQQLLSRLLLKTDVQISNEYHGVSEIQIQCRASRSVLIVLDGISEKRQLEMLAGSPDWFGPMSRIIITTRKKDIFRDPNYQDKMQQYNVELLSDTSAFSLFCEHAFGLNPPDDTLMDLCNVIIEKVGRHPLALIKIASSLYGQCIDVWEETLKSYRKLVYENVFFDALKTSYEELNEESKEVFLDLACFFNGEKVDRVIKILEGFGYSSPPTKLQLFADRCLIDILDGHIQMHILIIYMGQEIVSRELPPHQGKQKQSRIWLQEDVARAFREKYELKYIQGIMLDLEEEQELVLEAKSFAYMTELKILQINNVQLSEDVEFLSNQLTLLNWSGYSSKCLPSTFQPQPLVELHLPGSNVEQLWKGRKQFENLTEIDVRDSKYLVETPDFSEVPNLRRLIFRNCESLQEVHSSINSHKRLVLLDMEGCVNFRRFSSAMNCRRLKTLVLSNSGLELFPKFGRRMKCLVELHIDGTFIHELSPSITHLTALVLLNLKNCIRLSSLPTKMSRLSSLKTLILNSCKNLDQLPKSLENIVSLEELDIGGTSISHAPIVDPSLWNLRVLNCERLKRNIWLSLASLSRHFKSLTDLNLSDCNLVDGDIPNDLYHFSSLEILDLSNNHFVWLSDSLEQLVNLKALYLNDCNHLKQLPRLPASLQHLGGENSFEEAFRNSKGSSANTSSYLLSNPLSVPSNKTLVGTDNNQVEKVCILLDLENSNDTIFVGIFGSGGIGKTSIVEVVYKRIVDKFESSCFLYISKQKSLASLQNQMLSELLLREVNILDEDHRVQVIKDLMSDKKVLVVLDGVDEKSQIEKVVGSLDWFTPGSRVIITSRNRDILHQLDYKYNMREYNVELLSHTNAYNLFCKHAFGDSLRDKDDLCHEIVEKVGRLPLALRTIGSSLHNKDFEVWEETLMRLSKVEEDFIDTILQRSRENKTLHPNAAKLIEEHVTDAYPFTPEKLEKLTDIQKAKLESQTLESLLVSGERDFVIRKNGTKVKISSLIGKNVGLYFSASWCPPCRRFTPLLAGVYEELVSKGDFEVIFVSSDRDENSFKDYFAKMPWFSIPFSDSDTKKSLNEVFKVRGIPHLVVLDSNGKVSTDQGVRLVSQHGVNAYPFTCEHIQHLKEQEEEAKRNQTISSILVSNSRNYVISNDGNQIPVSELEGKVIGLYFSMYGNWKCDDFTPILVDAYKKLKGKGQNFEIVLISLNDEDDKFNEALKTMPWLALPLKDEKCQKLVLYFELKTIPTLVIIGQDGKTLISNAAELIEEHGIDAYPFTPEKLEELAAIEKEKLEAQTLESILVHGEYDYVIERSGAKIPVSELVGKNILLYFSAHWCSPCRAFLPKLIEAYNEIKQKDKEFEVIFISSDRDQDSFQEFFFGMPWLALPFGDERKKFLNRRFKIEHIPALVAINQSGRTVSTDVENRITIYGADAYPFTDERVKQLKKQLEEEAKGWPEELQHELHEAHKLVRTRRSSYECDSCDGMGYDWSFCCKECDFDLHPKCALENKEGTNEEGK